MIIVGICGASGSGKSTLAKRIMEGLSCPCEIVGQDCYYRSYPEIPLEERRMMNFDDPSIFDYDDLITDVMHLQNGLPITRKGYDYTNHVRLDHPDLLIDPPKVLILEGIHIFYDKRLVPEYEFYLDSIESSSSGVWDSVLISGMVNSIKNEFGKPMVVVIKSQMGAPIYAFSGNKVYWEIQEDLPRFTKLMIDGMALYIHRANFQIIDKALLD